MDKREPLAAELNLSSANTRKLGRPLSVNPKVAKRRSFNHIVLLGPRSGVREIQIQIQMNPEVVVCVLAQEEQTRLALEKQQAEEEARERVIARRNTESDVQSVRE